jgi:hypothetical protein
MPVQHSYIIVVAGPGDPERSEAVKLSKPCPVSRAQQIIKTDLAFPSATQPAEPILIPKFAIYFADFPHLHYSSNQRLLILGT